MTGKDTNFTYTNNHPLKINLHSDVLFKSVRDEFEIVEKDDALSKYEKYRITEKTDIPDPSSIVSINGEIISTPADITAISGPSKAGKSAITQPIVAAAITNDSIIYDPIESLTVAKNDTSKAVIHIDTEQARWKHRNNIKAILKRANLTACPDHFLSYNIRQLPINDYKSSTLEICKSASEKFGGIFLIIIDGIADYIEDVNDAAQGNAIIKTIEEIAIIYNCPVIVIIHNNPNSDKERGHLGSQVQRKAGSVLTVKKDGDISFLEPRFLRYAGNGNIPAIQFKYDSEKGYHVSYGTRENEAIDKDQRRIGELKEVAKKALPAPNTYRYQEAIERIMRTLNKSERTAKDRFKEMNAHKFIIQANDLWRLNLETVQ